MTREELYIKRCFELARKGGIHVKSNPQVGAVLVYNDLIIGEGYHQKFGEPHAERNAVASVQKENQHLIKDSTLYVSLEPCCIVGKTPACSDLVIEQQIKKLVVSTSDPNPKVSGKSLELLKAKGVDIKTQVLGDEGKELIEPFIKNLQKLPYISLKWAKSKDNFIGSKDKQIWLSNKESKIYAHKLRAQNDGILVGTNTAIIDNPKLSLRHYPGSNPLRIVLDRVGKIPKSHHLLSDDLPTLLISSLPIEELPKNKENIVVDFDSPDFLKELFTTLYKQGICRLLVEGGAGLLKSVIKSNLWDRAHLIHTNAILEEGIKSPNLNGKLQGKIVISDNSIHIIKRK